MQSEDYPKLRECPFCGNEYPMITETSMGVQITCPACQTKFRCDCTSSHDYSKAETVKRWNRRAQPSNEPLTCDGCVNKGQYENELEYGYPSPCTRCKRRNTDNYRRPPEGSENDE